MFGKKISILKNFSFPENFFKSFLKMVILTMIVCKKKSFSSRFWAIAKLFCVRWGSPSFLHFPDTTIVFYSRAVENKTKLDSDCKSCSLWGLYCCYLSPYFSIFPKLVSLHLPLWFHLSRSGTLWLRMAQILQSYLHSLLWSWLQ